MVAATKTRMISARPMPKNSKLHELKDAKKSFVFEVTRAHVKGSIVGDPQNCAAACALRSLKGVKAAWVKRTATIIEHDDGRLLRYRNPRRLTAAVEQFDSSAGLFPPGKYVLYPHSASQLIGAYVSGKRNNKVTMGIVVKRKRPIHALR